MKTLLDSIKFNFYYDAWSLFVIQGGKRVRTNGSTLMYVTTIKFSTVLILVNFEIKNKFDTFK